MATKIIYHQVKPGIDCPDGIAAAWVAHKAHPDAEIVGCTYGGDLPVVGKGDRDGGDRFFGDRLFGLADPEVG